MAKQIDYFDPAVERPLRKGLKDYLRKFIISPTQWDTLDGLYATLQWNEIKFDTANASSLPDVEGLYMFVVAPKKINANFINYLFYIGETNSIQRRFGDYIQKKTAGPKSGQYQVYAMIDDFPNQLYFVYTTFPGLNQLGRRKIESEFLAGFMPPVNSKYPQQLQSIVLATYGSL